MNPSEIIQQRLLNQHISSTSCKTPEEIVSTLGAMQAQEYQQAKWAIGLRLQHLRDVDVENAFTKGEIIRTHILRPTWHFVSPKDIRWMLTISARRVKAANAFMYRKMDLEEKVFRKANSILSKSLEGGKYLTRAQLAAELERKKIIADGIRLSCIMMQAELDGVICSGPKDGKQFTYALLDERVPASKPLTKEEALAELTKRYFNSRGPATLHDFATWSGLTLAQVKKGVDILANHLHQVKVNGDSFYFMQNPMDKFLKEPLGHNMHLLPIYDEYIMGYKDRSFYFNPKNKANQKPTYTFDNTIISGGQIAGFWKRKINNSSIDMEYVLLKTFSKTDKKKFISSVDKYSKFLAMRVNLCEKK